jgi:hypothetical protein
MERGLNGWNVIEGNESFLEQMNFISRCIQSVTIPGDFGAAFTCNCGYIVPEIMQIPLCMKQSFVRTSSQKPRPRCGAETTELPKNGETCSWRKRVQRQRLSPLIPASQDLHYHPMDYGSLEGITIHDIRYLPHLQCRCYTAEPQIHE